MHLHLFLYYKFLYMSFLSRTLAVNSRSLSYSSPLALVSCATSVCPFLFVRAFSTRQSTASPASAPGPTSASRAVTVRTLQKKVPIRIPEFATHLKRKAQSVISRTMSVNATAQKARKEEWQLGYDDGPMIWVSMVGLLWARGRGREDGE